MELLGIAGKLLAVFGSVFAIYKATVELGPRRRTLLRKDYAFLESYIKAISTEARPHNLIVEKGYLALTGQQLAAREILFLLGLDYPSLALKNYARGRQFVEIPLGDRTSIRYRGKYDKCWVRKKYQWTQLTGYVFFALLALLPLLFLGELISFLGMLGALTLAAFGFLAFGALAFVFLFDYSRIVGAVLLMEGEFGPVQSSDAVSASSASNRLQPMPQGGAAEPVR